MLTREIRDIKTVEKGIIGHGVNCQGVMGAGVAAVIKKKYPIIYSKYKEYVYLNSQINKDPCTLLGKVQIVDINDELVICNCFTQESYGNDGKVYADLISVIEVIETMLLLGREKQCAVYIPPIGCGLGGLQLDDELLLILEELCGKESSEYYDVDLHLVDLE